MVDPTDVVETVIALMIAIGAAIFLTVIRSILD